MIEVKKRDNESVEGLLRRFTKRVQQSGVILRTKKRRFHTTPKSKREERENALRRFAIRDRREYLRKTGQLTEEDLRSRNPRIKAMIKRTIKK